MANWLWKGIEDSTNMCIIVTEQTVEGLQGLPQPEEQIDAWQRAWDEVTDELLEGEEVPADARADTAVRRKRPDAWVVSWETRRFLILDFTRPNDRCERSLHDTDLVKSTRYKSQRDLLARQLAGWEVEIQTYAVCFLIS
jgi:hypothetical protein